MDNVKKTGKKRKKRRVKRVERIATVKEVENRIKSEKEDISEDDKAQIFSEIKAEFQKLSDLFCVIAEFSSKDNGGS